MTPTSQAVPNALYVEGGGASLCVWLSGLSGHCGGLSRSLQTGVWGQSHLAGPLLFLPGLWPQVPTVLLSPVCLSSPGAGAGESFCSGDTKPRGSPPAGAGPA